MNYSSVATKVTAMDTHIQVENTQEENLNQVQEADVLCYTAGIC